MKIKRISKASVIKWLKKVFTLQTLAVVAAIIAALYAYKTYQDTKPAQISREYYVSVGSKINVDDKNDFINLMTPYYGRTLYFGSDYSNGFFPNGMPNIVNASSKSIKDFRLEIDVIIFGLSLDYNYINPDFEIVESDTIEYKLRYKYDVFHPKSAVPVPFQRLRLIDSCSVDDCLLRMFYRITYEGISEPKDFQLYYRVCYTDDDLQDQHKQLDDFLTWCYYNGSFTECRDNTIVTFVDEQDARIVNPPKRLNDAKFEKFKKEFIESRK